jgi:hypothetical protein
MAPASNRPSQLGPLTLALHPSFGRVQAEDRRGSDKAQLHYQTTKSHENFH